jgi:hypothetical protein
MVMERRGWRNTGKKGSLGVRDSVASGRPNHNTGGLAFWFLRAERYETDGGLRFRSVRARCREFDSARPEGPPMKKRESSRRVNGM